MKEEEEASGRETGRRKMRRGLRNEEQWKKKDEGRKEYVKLKMEEEGIMKADERERIKRTIWM